MGYRQAAPWNAKHILLVDFSVSSLPLAQCCVFWKSDFDTKRSGCKRSKEDGENERVSRMGEERVGKKRKVQGNHEVKISEASGAQPPLRSLFIVSVTVRQAACRHALFARL